MQSTETLVYTVAEVTELLGIGRQLTYALIRRNLIPHLRLGKKTIRIPKRGFDEMRQNEMWQWQWRRHQNRTRNNPWISDEELEDLYVHQGRTLREVAEIAGQRAGRSFTREATRLWLVKAGLPHSSWNRGAPGAPPHGYLYANEAAGEVGVCRATLLNWEDRGLVSAVRDPKGRRLFAVDVVAWLKEKRQLRKRMRTSACPFSDADLHEFYIERRLSCIRIAELAEPFLGRVVTGVSVANWLRLARIQVRGKNGSERPHERRPERIARLLRERCLPTDPASWPIHEEIEGVLAIH